MSKVKVKPKSPGTGRQRSPTLRKWQDRLADSDRVYGPEVAKMDEREALVNGDKKLVPLVKGDKKNSRATHVRNIIFENIESQVSTDIPQPQVTAVRQKDEKLATIIENWLRLELDRQHFEKMNDMAERTVPTQGGTLWMVEWDNRKRTHSTVGALKNSMIHPKQLGPQPGIYTGIEDMDWVIVKKPTTKWAVKREYGIDVWGESESEPEIRGTGSEDNSDDALTQYIGFEISETGGINRFSWVNDTVLEDLKNYQARRQPVCQSCGRVRPLPGQLLSSDVVMDETPAGDSFQDDAVAGHAMAHRLADQFMRGEEMSPGMELGEPEKPEPKKYDGGPCPWCGGDKWETQEMEYEQVILPIRTFGGTVIPGEHWGMNEMGETALVPTLIPFYKPDIYPLVLQRSVSVFGQLLGNSDVDAIRDQQNTTNRIEKKIIDRLLKAGTRVTLPDKANLRMDPEDGERWYLGNAAEKAMIGVYEFKGNLQFELMYLSQVYEEARQILGITDSFQGRQDPTATSGKAKEYSAAMAAGRLESKRVMKQAAYAEMFELMFKFQLAYADEPRPVTYKDFKGTTIYTEFNRYDFLERDESTGEWFWNDQFLFSCDTAGSLASNREAMWQETRQNLQSGAFGDPAATETLVLFWGKMELLHYPGAGETKKYLEDRMERERTQQMQMQMMQYAQQMQPAMQVPTGNQLPPAMTGGGGYTSM